MIYNGSFEEFYSCPFQNDLNNGEFEKVKGWWKPTAGTSDYFNRCNSGVVDIPDNFWGYQDTYEGDGYVGIVPVEWNETGVYVSFEYAQSKLTKTLSPCYKYKFTMYVSLAQYSTHSISKIGALFSEDTLYNDSSFNPPTVINEIPQVFNSSKNLSDSVNWTKIEGTFIAKGGEDFVTIGYFFPNVTNDTVFIQDYGIGSFATYYYIDSVSLYEIGLNIEECESFDFRIPNIFTPNSDLVNDVIDISEILFLKPKLTIYNRWGNLMINLDAENPIWDGAFDNKKCSEGVYYYLLEYETIKGKQTKNGYIQLIR